MTVDARRHELTEQYAMTILALVDKSQGMESHHRSAVIYPYLQKFAGIYNPPTEVRIVVADLDVVQATITEARQCLAEVEANNTAMRALLEDMRREHVTGDEAACASTYLRQHGCDCGADDWNARIDAVLNA